VLNWDLETIEALLEHCILFEEILKDYFVKVDVRKWKRSGFLFLKAIYNDRMI
jgi:hypothetical protein